MDCLLRSSPFATIKIAANAAICSKNRVILRHKFGSKYIFEPILYSLYPYLLGLLIVRFIIRKWNSRCGCIWSTGCYDQIRHYNYFVTKSFVYLSTLEHAYMSFYATESATSTTPTHHEQNHILLRWPFTSRWCLL